MSVTGETSDAGVTGPSGPQLVIWGTDVVVNQCKDKFKKFVLTFVDPTADGESEEGGEAKQPVYLPKLEEVCFLSINSFCYVIVNIGNLS